MTTDQGKAVAHHESTYIPPTASLNTLGASVILGLADLRFSHFPAQSVPATRFPQEGETQLAVGDALHDRDVFILR